MRHYNNIFFCYDCCRAGAVSRETGAEKNYKHVALVCMPYFEQWRFYYDYIPARIARQYVIDIVDYSVRMTRCSILSHNVMPYMTKFDILKVKELVREWKWSLLFQFYSQIIEQEGQTLMCHYKFIEVATLFIHL